MTKIRHGAALLAGWAAGLGLPAVAAAQEAAAVAAGGVTPATSAAAAQTPEPDFGGDIVVTAQRREERAHDVPISLAVTSGAQLQSLHLLNSSDLRYVVPGFTFSDKAKTSSQGTSLRGIGTVALLSNGVEQSVGTVIDGVVIGRTQGSSPELIDIERIEVLRGPQGTLFGKNASAGVVNIVTKDPVFKDSYGLNVSIASYNDLRVDGVANVAINDKLAGRFVGYLLRRDGFVNNVYNGKVLHNRFTFGFRGKMLYEPTDRLHILLNGDFSRRDDDCCAHLVDKQAPNGNAKKIPGALVGGPYNTTVNIDTAPSTKTDLGGASLTINYDIGDYVVTSVSADREFKSYDTFDSDGFPVPIVENNSNVSHWHQFSQEFRLASPASDRLSYVLGLFYFQQSFNNLNLQTGSLAYPVVRLLGHTLDDTVRSKSYAAFGQGTFRLTDAVRLIGGLRYTKEKISESYAEAFVAGYGPWPRAIAGRYSGSVKPSNVSYKAGAQADLSKAIMVFATYSTGYKAPGINPFANTIDVTNKETSRSAEAGIKAEFFNRRFAVNAAFFDTKIDGFQASVVDFSINPPPVRIVSAGSMVSRGGEMDFTGRPFPQLLLFGGVSYAPAKFGKFGLTPCYAFQTAAQGCVAGNFDPSGKPVPNAPKWTATFTGRYDIAMPSRSFDGFVQGSWAYKSSVNFLLNTDPSTRQAGFSLFDASAGVQSHNGRWRATVFVRNIFDQHFVTGLSPQTQDGPGAYFHYVTLDAQRTAGLTLQLSL